MARSDESEPTTDELLADVERLTEDAGQSSPTSSPESSPTSSTKTTASTRSKSASETDQGASRSRLARLFSPKTFLVALVLSVVAVVAGGAVPLVGFVGRLVGLFVVAFGIGILGDRRHYLEVALAGAVASGLGFVVGVFTSAFFPFALNLLSEYGIAVAGVGAGVGALASLVGHYVGRDLRDGLTRDL